MNTYVVKFENIMENRLIIAKNFDEAVLKAKKALAKLNAELKAKKDSRFPDNLATIEYDGTIDE